MKTAKPIHIESLENYRGQIFNEMRKTDFQNKTLEKLDEIKTSHDKSYADLKSQCETLKEENAGLLNRVEELESRRMSPGRTGRPVDPIDRVESWIDPKTGEKVPVLNHSEKLSDLYPNQTGISLGQYLRFKITGRYLDSGERREGREILSQLEEGTDSAGGFTVPKILSPEIIDNLRARLVLSRAGARMVPMSSKTLTLVRIATDATVGWHAENASITPSDPTFSAAVLDSKTIVGVVKMSLELSQDSLNVEEAIVRSLTGGAAVAIDAAGLGNTVSNGPSGILSFTGRSQITSIGSLSNYDPFIDGIGKLMASNVPEDRIGPIVIGVRALRDLRKIKTGISGDLTTLVPPPGLPQMLPTTAVETVGSPNTTSTAYLADWADLLWGIRRDIQVRVISEAFLGSNLQVAVLVYMRCDFQPGREMSFCSLEGISSAS